MRPIPPATGAELFLRFLDHPEPQVALMSPRSDMGHSPLADRPLLSELPALKRAMAAAPPSAAAVHGASVVAAAPSSTGSVEHRVQDAVVQVLGLRQQELAPARNLLEQGLDSLGAIRLRNVLTKAVGITLPLERVLDSPTVESLVRDLRRVGAHKEERAVRRPQQDPGLPFPLSRSQLALWHLAQLAPDSAAYNICLVIRLEGVTDEAALGEAWSDLVQRHDMLRLVLRSGEDGAVFQQVSGRAQTPLETCTVEPSQDLGRLLRQWLTRPFPLEDAAPCRALLATVEPTERVFALAAHHMVLDGRSLGLLAADLLRLYCARQLRQPVPRRSTAPSFRDYLQWRREPAMLARQKVDWTYWESELGGAPSSTTIPSRRSRPTTQRFEGQLHRFSLGDELSQQLVQFVRAEGCTPFGVLVSALYLLLQRYTAQHDLVLGIAMRGRTEPRFEQTVGYLTNTVALRAKVESSSPFRAVVEQVREKLVLAMQHQNLPFPTVVQRLGIRRTPGQSPLFQVFVDDLTPPPLADDVRHAVDRCGISAQPVHLAQMEGQFDLSLFILAQEPELELGLAFNTTLYDGADAERLALHYVQLLRGGIGQPERPTGALPMLTPDEHQALERWNSRPVELPPRATPLRVFNMRVRRSPSAACIWHDGIMVDYGGVARRCAAITRQMRQLGLGMGDVVGLYMPREPGQVAALLAIWELGAIALPLGPELPPQRRAWLLSDAGAAGLITCDRLAHELPPDLARLQLVVVSAGAALDETSPTVDSPGPAADAPALLSYTSSATGTPSGVLVSHRSLLNVLSGVRRVMGLGPDDVVLALSPASHYAATLELLLPLMAGASMELADSAEALDGPTLARRLDGGRATVVYASPTTWNLVVAGGWRGTRMVRALVDADRLPPTFASRLLSRASQAWGVFGLTETGWAGVGALRAVSDRCAIDHPLPNTRLYVLDDQLQHQAPWIEGELYVAGAGLAQGYHQRHQATAAAFVPDPHAAAGGERMFRTGDLARRLPDGSIELTGRRDRQVAVRGFRVEPREVEAVLLEHEMVSEAVVEPVHSTATGPALRVYYVAPGKPAPAALRQHLARRLPDYMVPQSVVRLDQMPRSADGQVDRRQLREPVSAPTNRGSSDASVQVAKPTASAEARVSAAWCRVLGQDHVPVDRGFFDAGGHSLLIPALLTELQRETGRSFSTAEVLRWPTVGAQARQVATEPRRPGSRSG